MVQRLITEYFDVRTGQESSIIDGLMIPMKQRLDADRLETRHGLGLSGYLDNYQAEKLISKVTLTVFSEIYKSLDDHYGKKEYQYFLEKTPSNVMFVNEILHFVPNAKIIVVDRNIHDIVKSLIRARTTWGSDWIPTSIKGMVNFVCQHVDAVKSSHTLHNKNLFVIDFDEVKLRPHEFLERLSSFLEIEIKKPFWPSFEQALLSAETDIPIKINGAWSLLREGEHFIKNRTQMKLLARLELHLILYLVQLKRKKND